MGNKNWEMLRELDGNTSSVLGHQVEYTLHLLLFVSPSRLHLQPASDFCSLWLVPELGNYHEKLRSNYCVSSPFLVGED